MKARVWIAAVLLTAGSATAQDRPGGEAGCAAEVAAALHPEPPGRDIAAMDRASCHALLEARGIDFDPVPRGEARGVGIPIRLRGAVAGIEVTSRGQRSESLEILDCRLAVALLAWSPHLQEEGVAAIRHYSVYRPGARVGGSGRVSGHAHALAIDLGRVEWRDGESVDVLHGWAARERGAPPCEGDYDEPPASARLRRLVCDAVERDLFQVVLTPHHDRAHANHVHLEVRPGVDWSYVH